MLGFLIFWICFTNQHLCEFFFQLTSPMTWDLKKIQFLSMHLVHSWSCSAIESLPCKFDSKFAIGKNQGGTILFDTQNSGTCSYELCMDYYTHRVISDKVHRLLVTLSFFRPDRFVQLLSLIPILILLLHLLVSKDLVYTGLRELVPEWEQLFF